MTEQLNLCQNINIEPGRRSRTLTGWQSSGLGGGQVTPVAQRPAESRQAAGVRRYCGKVCSNLGKVKNAVPGQWHNNKPKLYEGSGYIYVWEPDHPHARRYGWVFEHRLVMEKVLGRYLTQEEEVNHINEVKDDNRPENLEVLDEATHTRITFTSHRSKVKAKHDAPEAKLAEYERRFGPLPSGT
ncbi:HNH endonuclease [Nonomuraea maritima]|uniref:HNH endonuclease n=1 Tax=Nonomuraea maritima TaxID=683260 RepID=A0A1G9DIP7_9ACTN|nr:HNH endonuclease [Nonomuraea maritima]SDK63782.1 HNH endonuclease [Nonomuraea maritima]